jgi:hypothetical protein
MVLMTVSSTVEVVDGGGNDGVFTTTSHDDDRHPRPHRPCPLSDEDWMAGWRVRRDASHVSFVVVTVVVIGASFVSIRRMTAPRTMAAATDKAVMLISTAGKRWDTTTPSAWSNKNKTKTKQKQNQQQWRQRHHLCTCRQLRPCCHCCCLCGIRVSSGSSTGVAVAAAAAAEQ